MRQIKDRVPVAVLLETALARTGYDAVLLAEYLGQRKLANLHKLIERARVADQGGSLDFDGFITQLSQFIAQQPKEALAATAAETSNVIRLMTIHQAKGLEFPLVVVPDLDRNLVQRTPPAAFDAELGPLVSYALDEDERPTTGMTLYMARERAAELEERKRLLYVACTRAADHLILSSSLESCDEPASDWMKLLAARFNLSTGELREPLPPGYETPPIRVSLGPPAGESRSNGKSRGPDLLEMLADAHHLADAGALADVTHVGPLFPDRSARRQFSVSRLSGQIVPPVEAVDENERTGDGELGASMARAETEIGAAGEPLTNDAANGDARGLGLLVHDVLARIDFADPTTVAKIPQLCELLAPQYVDQMELEKNAAATARDLVGRLLKSPRGRAMATAADVHRELEFLLTWPAEYYLRGFIDCLYRDGDGWHLIDYKTNDVSAAGCREAARQYEMQLYVYALAAERALGVAPVEVTLCFLRPGVEHTFAWNDAARRRAIEMVDAAIQRFTSDERPVSHAPSARGPG